MKQNATASVGLIQMILKFVSNRGIDFDEICETAGLAPSIFENMDERIPIEQYEAIWKEAIVRTGGSKFWSAFWRTDWRSWTPPVLRDNKLSQHRSGAGKNLSVSLSLI